MIRYKCQLVTFGIETAAGRTITLTTMWERCYYIYIVSSRTHVLYIGVTNDIQRRMREHKSCDSDSFAATDRCNRLMWLEEFTSPSAAIDRETQLKGWRRSKK